MHRHIRKRLCWSGWVCAIFVLRGLHTYVNTPYRGISYDSCWFYHIATLQSTDNWFTVSNLKRNSTVGLSLAELGPRLGKADSLVAMVYCMSWPFLARPQANGMFSGKTHGSTRLCLAVDFSVYFHRRAHRHISYIVSKIENKVNHT